MKKILLVGLIALLSIGANAQTTIYQPYVGVGTGVSSNVQSFSAELGIYNSNTWYAVGITSTDYAPDNVWSTSVKGYWRINNRKEANKEVDAYATGEVNMTLNRYHYLTFAPGAAVVWNVTKRVAPQFGISFPIGENSVLRERPIAVQASLGLNYWIK